MSGHSRPSSKGREVYSHVLTNSKGQVQNVKAARVYVFGNDDIVEDEDGENVVFEMPEMRSRRGQADTSSAVSTAACQTEQEEVFFEKEIGDGETLQSLSLKYACPMSELKRINNLIKEQDFYALRVLKIPMRPHGILSEIVKQEQAITSAKQNKPSSFHNSLIMASDSDIPDEVCSDVDFSDPEMQMRVMRSVSIRETSSRQGQEADRFLKKVDKDLQKIRETGAAHSGSLDEVVSVLSNSRSISPLLERRHRHNGADCGVRWWVIVLVAVCLAIIVPTIYFLVIKYHFKDLGLNSAATPSERNGS